IKIKTKNSMMVHDGQQNILQYIRRTKCFQLNRHMKLTNFVYLTFLILLCSLCVKAQRNFDGQAHRGGAGLMPENTVVAAKNALRLGCTIEMDVYMSKDSQLIVTHDPHIMS